MGEAEKTETTAYGWGERSGDENTYENSWDLSFEAVFEL